jgi:hypothetical protein
MDITALNTELITDPLGRGYSGMTDEEATDDLNTEYRDVNYPILIDLINQSIRDNGKWTEFRESADIQTVAGTYDNQSMREFMDIFTTFTSIPNVDVQGVYMTALLAAMVVEGSMGAGAETAISILGIQTVSRSTELFDEVTRTAYVVAARAL